MDPTDNLLLAALPERERQELVALMTPVALPLGQLIYEQDAPVSDVYFFTSGAASVLVLMENGAALEPAIIGREGMLGFPIGLGAARSRWRSIMQLPGEALVMPRDTLSERLRLGGDLPLLLAHYAGLLVTFVAQSAACSHFHSLERRTARWLLLMHDRARSDVLVITHEYLAFMLGANRPSETLVLRSLSDRGFIEMRRGEIRIIDRTALLRETCECYERVAIAYDRSVSVDRAVEPGPPGSSYP